MLDRRLEIMLSLLWCNNASSITCCYERDGLDAEVQTDEDETDSIFETLDEDSGQYRDEEEENDYFAEDDRRDEESLRRKGYTIVSSSDF